MDLAALQARLLRTECQLADFGNATRMDSERLTNEIQTRPYRAPEVRPRAQPVGDAHTLQAAQRTGLHRCHRMRSKRDCMNAAACAAGRAPVAWIARLRFLCAAGSVPSTRPSQQPALLPHLASQVILEAGFGPPADIWSLGCLVFELATGQFLFRPRTVGTRARDRDHLIQVRQGADFSILVRVSTMCSSRQQPYAAAAVQPQEHEWPEAVGRPSAALPPLFAGRAF